ncbi:MAG: glycoside hydrolase family 36 N-terminal domain-containing protein, partial [Microbacterium sp.]
MTVSHVHLEAHGVALVLEFDGAGLPSVLHWGAPLGAVGAADLEQLSRALSRQRAGATLDASWQVPIFAAEADGWSGRPGLQVRTAAGILRPRWRVTRVDAADAAVTVEANDESSGLGLTWIAAIESGGLVWLDARLQAGAESIEVDWLEPTLPVPTTTTHLTTFDGRWTREKRPVTTSVPAGAVARQTRRGRPGHDAPTVAVLSIGAPRWGAGAVWGVHAAWS